MVTSSPFSLPLFFLIQKKNEKAGGHEVQLVTMITHAMVALLFLSFSFVGFVLQLNKKNFEKENEMKKGREK